MPEQERQSSKDRTKCVDLVFEGGGVKGVGLLGALSVLQERGFQVQSVAGASAGAIVATLLAAGYVSEELYPILVDLDFKQFLDRGREDNVPLIAAPVSIYKDAGIYEGQAFLEWMAKLLQAKDVETFRDLIHPDFGDDDPRYRYRVQVIASDLTLRQLLVLPRDARLLGVEPDDFGVALAVRMSMSIPVFFEPVQFLNPRTGQLHLIVDGGMLSNFPVWLFDCGDGEPEWPTFGLMLAEKDPRNSLASQISPQERSRMGVAALSSYLKSLVETMMAARDRMYLENADFARTIMIPTMGVRATDFDITRERSLALYASGRKAAEDFLEDWDFDEYIARFRAGKPTSRRKHIFQKQP